MQSFQLSLCILQIKYTEHGVFKEGQNLVLRVSTGSRRFMWKYCIRRTLKGIIAI